MYITCAFVWSYAQFGRNRLGDFVDETLRNGHSLPQTVTFSLKRSLSQAVTVSLKRSLFHSNGHCLPQTVTVYLKRSLSQAVTVSLKRSLLPQTVTVSLKRSLSPSNAFIVCASGLKFITASRQHANSITVLQMA